MNLLQRAKESGRCAPSFLSEQNLKNDDGFESDLLGILAAGTGFSLSSDPTISTAFSNILKKTKGIDSVPGSDENEKKAVLQLRRVLILAIVGGTPKSNPSLDRILETDYLLEVKDWLEEILKEHVGGVDMLLHLLKNIAELPVTTSMVKQSGLGKLVGSIEKHRICSGPNAVNIQERVELVKSSWKASVKARKIAEGTSQPALKIAVDSKRSVPETGSTASPSAKRAKVSESPAKSSSLSSLLTKMSASSGSKSKQGQTNGVKIDDARTKWKSNNSVSPQATHKKKKASVRVKWVDHFGGDLAESRLIEGENIVQDAAVSAESWSDRKKRDREKEKKLLLTMKKAKLLDEDDGDLEPAASGMKASVPWKTPALLPELPDVPKPELNSSQVTAQNQRNQTVTAAMYSTDNSVPSSPAPLSDIEQAIDMTAQSAANVAKMPFFASHQPETAAPAPTNEITRQYKPEYAPPPPEASAPAPVGATVDFVQALGLPLFLVGQDTQALQTLASSPGLLNSFVDSTGHYDQTRLLSLVQTLTGAPVPSHVVSPAIYPSQVPPVSPYLPGGVYPPYSETSHGSSKFANSLAPPTVLRSGSDEGNLHVSGYGPMTTQTDLIALFSPFVVVNEVVMKGTFAFVNTNDPVNAQRAREALTGTLVGGQPIRINQAQRKAKESGPHSRSNFPAPTSYGLTGSVPVPSQTFPFAAPGAPPNLPPQHFQPQPTSIDDVRDSRGNAPTKNLFVAGYGPGTSEAQMRQLFSQHCNVVGVVLKGNFTFVNTGSREDAVKAREMLQGNMINGGPLRINFAKETGRLGTSFDLTYNQQSGPNGARRPTQPPLPPPVSYYGRN